MYGPGEARPWYWTLHDYAFRTLFLFLAFRTFQWAAGRAGRPLGVLVLFYWAYWIEHALVLGTPRFGLAVYPVLIAMLFPQIGPVPVGDSRTGGAHPR